MKYKGINIRFRCFDVRPADVHGKHKTIVSQKDLFFPTARVELTMLEENIVLGSHSLQQKHLQSCSNNRNHMQKAHAIYCVYIMRSLVHVYSASSSPARSSSSFSSISCRLRRRVLRPVRRVRGVGRFAAPPSASSPSSTPFPGVIVDRD